MVDLKEVMKQFKPVDTELLSDSTIEITPEMRDACLHYNKALEEIQDGYRDLARYNFKKATILYPEFSGAFLALGACTFVNGDRNGAMRIFNSIKDPEDRERGMAIFDSLTQLDTQSGEKQDGEEQIVPPEVSMPETPPEIYEDDESMLEVAPKAWQRSEDNDGKQGQSSGSGKNGTKMIYRKVKPNEAEMHPFDYVQNKPSVKKFDQEKDDDTKVAPELRRVGKNTPSQDVSQDEIRQAGSRYANPNEYFGDRKSQYGTSSKNSAPSEFSMTVRWTAIFVVLAVFVIVSSVLLISSAGRISSLSNQVKKLESNPVSTQSPGPQPTEEPPFATEAPEDGEDEIPDENGNVG